MDRYALSVTCFATGLGPCPSESELSQKHLQLADRKELRLFFPHGFLPLNPRRCGRRQSVVSAAQPNNDGKEVVVLHGQALAAHFVRN